MGNGPGQVRDVSMDNNFSCQLLTCSTLPLIHALSLPFSSGLWAMPSGHAVHAVSDLLMSLQLVPAMTQTLWQSFHS
jgi:hypothetical protein